MKIETVNDDAISTIVRVTPWPEHPFGADVTVLHQKTDLEMLGHWPRRAGDTAVRYGQNWMKVDDARTFAEAILKACEIADTLPRLPADDEPSPKERAAMLAALEATRPRTAEPHSDGDFSYLCGNPYCRCCS